MRDPAPVTDVEASDPPPALDAAVAAKEAAALAGVVVRQVHDLAPMQGVVDLFVDVWQTRAMDPPVNRDFLRALSHAGGYVAGAYAGGDLVGASVGFLGTERSLHSHISGVRSGEQSRGVGRALKLDQRSWCLERDVSTITWTFDPLVRRNAWFNLAKLGVTCVEYLLDFYGSMKDGVNAGDSSDRLYARWDLVADRVAAAVAGTSGPPARDVLLGDGARLLVEEVDGRPVARTAFAPTGPTVLLVGTPADVVAVRASDRDLASEWRHAVRDAMHPAIDAGWSVTSMTRDGYYVLTKDGDAL